MSKHLTPNEWIKLFELYQDDPGLCWKELSKSKKITPSSKYWFRQKYRKFLKHNEDIRILESKTGTTPKKGKGSGRPRKNKIQSIQN